MMTKRILLEIHTTINYLQVLKLKKMTLTKLTSFATMGKLQINIFTMYHKKKKIERKKKKIHLNEIQNIMNLRH